MTKQINHISVLQTSKVLGVVYLFFGAFYTAYFLIYSTLMGFPLPSINEIIALVVYFPIIGFISVLFFTFVYNLVVKYVGGIEFTLND